MSTSTPGPRRDPKRDPNRNAPPNRPQSTEPARPDRAKGTSQDGRAMSSVGSPRRQDGRTKHGPNTIRSNRTNLRAPGPAPIRSNWAESTAYRTTSKSVVPSIQPSSCLVNRSAPQPQTQDATRAVGTIRRTSIPLNPASADLHQPLKPQPFNPRHRFVPTERSAVDPASIRPKPQNTSRVTTERFNPHTPRIHSPRSRRTLPSVNSIQVVHIQATAQRAAICPRNTTEPLNART